MSEKCTCTKHYAVDADGYAALANPDGTPLYECGAPFLIARMVEDANSRGGNYRIVTAEPPMRPGAKLVRLR